jgi:hypothetical protein
LRAALCFDHVGGRACGDGGERIRDCSTPHLWLCRGIRCFHGHHELPSLQPFIIPACCTLDSLSFRASEGRKKRGGLGEDLFAHLSCPRTGIKGRRGTHRLLNTIDVPFAVSRTASVRGSGSILSRRSYGSGSRGGRKNAELFDLDDVSAVCGYGWASLGFRCFQ